MINGMEKKKEKKYKALGSCSFGALFPKIGKTDLVCKALTLFPSRFVCFVETPTRIFANLLDNRFLIDLFGGVKLYVQI